MRTQGNHDYGEQSCWPGGKAVRRRQSRMLWSELKACTSRAVLLLGMAGNFPQMCRWGSLCMFVYGKTQHYSLSLIKQKRPRLGSLGQEGEKKHGGWKWNGKGEGKDLLFLFILSAFSSCRSGLQAPCTIVCKNVTSASLFAREGPVPQGTRSKTLSNTRALST